MIYTDNLLTTMKKVKKKGQMGWDRGMLSWLMWYTVCTFNGIWLYTPDSLYCLHRLVDRDSYFGTSSCRIIILFRSI
jgi:hypothetical protein